MAEVPVTQRLVPDAVTPDDGQNYDATPGKSSNLSNQLDAIVSTISGPVVPEETVESTLTGRDTKLPTTQEMPEMSTRGAGDDAFIVNPER